MVTGFASCRFFSDKCRFSLRALFFAYEDHAQIIRLIVETYKRLAATKNAEVLAISAKLLWKKTTSIMTNFRQEMD